MEYIRVTKDNLEKEHICCAISNNKDIQVSSKKSWLADRFDEGLVFLKSTERGKCFIEYIPAEYAWVPIDARGYMYIDCLWVSGSFKGHGYSSDLLNACIGDSKEKGLKGLCILAAAKKKPFLADPKFLKYKGFTVCDEADNGIQLWYLPFDQDTDKPRFKECAKHPQTDERDMFCTIPASVRLMRSTCRFWSRRPKRIVLRSMRFISRTGKMRRTLRHQSRIMPCSMMESILQTSR